MESLSLRSYLNTLDLSSYGEELVRMHEDLLRDWGTRDLYNLILNLDMQMVERIFKNLLTRLSEDKNVDLWVCVLTHLKSWYQERSKKAVVSWGESLTPFLLGTSSKGQDLQARHLEILFRGIQNPTACCEKDVEWIVNDNGELGVSVGGRQFFLYKGESICYTKGTHDDGSPVFYRAVQKREFGECCRPVEIQAIRSTNNPFDMSKTGWYRDEMWYLDEEEDWKQCASL